MMPIAWERKWGIILHPRFSVTPSEYKTWTLRDVMEAMTAKAVLEDAEVHQINAHRAEQRGAERGRR